MAVTMRLPQLPVEPESLGQRREVGEPLLGQPALASALESRVGIKRALTPSSRYSAGPPTRVETSGVPWLMHSTMNSDVPS